MERRKSVTRRGFLEASAAAGVALAGRQLGSSPSEAAAAQPKPSLDAEPEGKEAAIVIDCHAHLAHHSSANYAERDRKLIEAANKLGIDQLCCSLLTPKRPATAEGFRECNAWTAEAMKEYSGRVLGWRKTGDL